MGKLGLVGGVGLAWLLTFVLMGGDVLPALSSSPSAPTTSAAPRTGPTPGKATPIGPAVEPTAAPAQSKPDKGGSTTALQAEQLASITPVGGAVLAARPKARRSAPPVLSFRMASFNLLGSSHTVHSKKYASGSARASKAARFVLDHDFSVVGFQEIQSDQRNVFMNATGGKWGMYPGNQLRPSDADNSIVWRLDTWELIKPGSISIPYFGGRPKNMPVIKLRNKQTGIAAYFSNFHNPADKFGNAARYRNAAKIKQANLTRDLRSEGYPVFMTGDMNERGTWFCGVAPAGDLRSSSGETARDGCSSSNKRIDWLVGSYDVEFSGYTVANDSLVDSITDHPIIYADVKIDSRDFPRSLD